ncbi:coiled-coil domain-containing protein, partial [[Kitasatospora] papulosa]
MNRRHCATAAITLVCALALLTAPVQAMAAPIPEPGPTSTAPAAAGKSLDEVRQEIDTLYRMAGAATDAYNLAEEQAKKQSGEIVRLTKSIADGQAKIAELKDRAGAQAREQYRNGGLPPGAQLVLSGDPDLFMDGVNQARQGQQATKGMLTELEQAQEDLETYTKDANLNWEKIEANRVKQAKAKKNIDGKIEAAEKLESQLAKEERARLLELEQNAAYTAQTAWLSSGALKDINREASAAGKQAVAFATGQIGKPYVWGAEGPGSYD